MKKHSHSHRSLRLALHSLVLGSGLAGVPGCASDSVDLGGGTVTQELQRGSRCAEDVVVAERVIIAEQADVNALTGCQELQSDLIIQLFPDADLRPLHDLRAVEGLLVIGLEASFNSFVTLPAERELEITDRDFELLESGWLDSLAGLEGLERAGGIFLQATSVTDLSGFAGLRSVGGPVGSGTFDRSGSFTVASNRNLVDLTGLENVRGIDALTVLDSPSLESLSGFTPGSSLTSLTLSRAPALTDLSQLASLRTVDSLQIDGVGASDLGALSQLESVLLYLSVSDNAELVDASALSNLVEAGESIRFSNNSALRELPSFNHWLRLPDELLIEDNAALQSIVLDFETPVGTRTLAGSDRFVPMGVVSIENNAQLQSVSIPPAIYNMEAGLTAVDLFSLGRNPSLSSVNFGGLRRASLLAVNENPSLSQVALGALERVEDLEVIDNPQLSAAVFDDVVTFERTLSGNQP